MGSIVVEAVAFKSLLSVPFMPSPSMYLYPGDISVVVASVAVTLVNVVSVGSVTLSTVVVGAAENTMTDGTVPGGSEKVCSVMVSEDGEGVDVASAVAALVAVKGADVPRSVVRGRSAVRPEVVVSRDVTPIVVSLCVVVMAPVVRLASPLDSVESVRTAVSPLSFVVVLTYTVSGSEVVVTPVVDSTSFTVVALDVGTDNSVVIGAVTLLVVVSGRVVPAVWPAVLVASGVVARPRNV